MAGHFAFLHQAWAAGLAVNHIDQLRDESGFDVVVDPANKDLDPPRARCCAGRFVAELSKGVVRDVVVRAPQVIRFVGPAQGCLDFGLSTGDRLRKARVDIAQRQGCANAVPSEGTIDRQSVVSLKGANRLHGGRAKVSVRPKLKGDSLVDQKRL